MTSSTKRRRIRRTIKDPRSAVELGRNSGLDRGPDGRFLPKNSASRGNGGQRSRARFRRALEGCVSDADVRDVIAAAVSQARRGDRHARRWLTEQLDGLPRRAPDDPVVVEGLPKVKNAATALEALGVLVERAAEGTIDAPSALHLARLISHVRAVGDSDSSWIEGDDDAPLPRPDLL